MIETRRSAALDGRYLVTLALSVLALVVLALASSGCKYDDPALKEEERALQQRSIELLEQIASGEATPETLRESGVVARRLEELRQQSTGEIDWGGVAEFVGMVGASVAVSLGAVRKWRGPINDRRGNIPTAP